MPPPAPSLEEQLAALKRGELQGLEVLGASSDPRVDAALARLLARATDPTLRERVGATLLWRNTEAAHDALRAAAAAGPAWHALAARSVLADRRAGAAELARLAAAGRSGDDAAAGVTLAALEQIAHTGGAVPMPGPWLDTVAALRGDDRIGAAARRTLRAFPRAEALRAVAKVPAHAPPPASAPGSGGAYRTAALIGWDAFVARTQLSDGERAAAERECEAMMRIVAVNADRVVQRLAALGWRFGGEARGVAAAHTWGHHPVPLALATFWRVVGGIDLAAREGEPPAWLTPAALRASEPLVVLPAWRIEDRIEHWEHELAAHGSVEIVGPLAYDVGAHGASLVLGAAEPLDPWVLERAERTRFVAHLRTAFRWGGLPGLAHVERSAELDEVLTELADGLEPF